MNYFDLVVLLLVAASVYFGYKTGIITSLFYILSGFIGMWVAQKYANGLKFDFYVVFMATAASVIIIGFVVSHLIKKLPFIWIDHLCGALLGLILGFVITGTVVFPVSYHFPKKAKDIVVASFTAEKLIPKFQKLFPKVKQFELKDIKDKMPELPKLPLISKDK